MASGWVKAKKRGHVLQAGGWSSTRSQLSSWILDVFSAAHGLLASLSRLTRRARGRPFIYLCLRRPSLILLHSSYLCASFTAPPESASRRLTLKHLVSSCKSSLRRTCSSTSSGSSANAHRPPGIGWSYGIGGRKCRGGVGDADSDFAGVGVRSIGVSGRLVSNGVDNGDGVGYKRSDGVRAVMSMAKNENPALRVEYWQKEWDLNK